MTFKCSIISINGIPDPAAQDRVNSRAENSETDNGEKAQLEGI